MNEGIILVYLVLKFFSIFTYSNLRTGEVPSTVCFFVYKFSKELQNPKKGSVNIQNYADEKCFIWSLLALFNPTSRRIRKCIRYKGELDIQGITYPSPNPSKIIINLKNKTRTFQSMFMGMSMRKYFHFVSHKKEIVNIM